MNKFIADTLSLYSDIVSPVTRVHGQEVSFDGSQIQDEFFEAWNCIDKYYGKTTTHISFLEIGAYKGLWALALYQFCKARKISFEYATVTYMSQDPNNRPLYAVEEYFKSIGESFTLINSPSQDTSVLQKLPATNYNIVFIDGDHRYDMVKQDIEIYKPLAKDILMFHDIRPIYTNPSCGVYQAVEDTGISLDEQIVVNGQWMGIGIHYV